MAEAVKSTQLAAGNVSGTTPVTVYTVPTGKRVILKSAALQNRSGAATILWLQAPTGAYPLKQPLDPTGGAGAHFEWRPWLVLSAGQTIALNTSGAQQVDYVLSGSVLFV